MHNFYLGLRRHGLPHRRARPCPRSAANGVTGPPYGTEICRWKMGSKVRDQGAKPPGSRRSDRLEVAVIVQDPPRPALGQPGPREVSFLIFSMNAGSWLFEDPAVSKMPAQLCAEDACEHVAGLRVIAEGSKITGVDPERVQYRRGVQDGVDV